MRKLTVRRHRCQCYVTVVPCQAPSPCLMHTKSLRLDTLSFICIHILSSNKGMGWAGSPRDHTKGVEVTRLAPEGAPITPEVGESALDATPMAPFPVPHSQLCVTAWCGGTS